MLTKNLRCKALALLCGVVVPVIGGSTPLETFGEIASVLESKKNALQEENISAVELSWWKEFSNKKAGFLSDVSSLFAQADEILKSNTASPGSGWWQDIKNQLDEITTAKFQFKVMEEANQANNKARIDDLDRFAAEVKNIVSGEKQRIDASLNAMFSNVRSKLEQLAAKLRELSSQKTTQTSMSMANSNVTWPTKEVAMGPDVAPILDVPQPSAPPVVSVPAEPVKSITPPPVVQSSVSAPTRRSNAGQRR